MTVNGHVGSRAFVVEPRAVMAALIVDRLKSSPGVEAVVLPAGGNAGGGIASAIVSGRGDIVVYSPLKDRARDLIPDVAKADDVLGACVRARVRKIVLLSSATAFGADYHNPGLLRESRPASTRRSNRVATAWRAVEDLAARKIDEGGATRLTILRASMTLVEGATDWVNRLFRRRWAITVAGYNPSIQLLDAADLAEAIELAVASDATGVFNSAPNGVVPFAFRFARDRRAPDWQRCPGRFNGRSRVRAALQRLGLASSGDQQEYLRYSWTVSNARSRNALGMGYTGSTLETPQRPPWSGPRGTDPSEIKVRTRSGSTSLVWTSISFGSEVGRLYASWTGATGGSRSAAWSMSLVKAARC